LFFVYSTHLFFSLISRSLNSFISNQNHHHQQHYIIYSNVFPQKESNLPNDAQSTQKQKFSSNLHFFLLNYQQQQEEEDSSVVTIFI